MDYQLTHNPNTIIRLSDGAIIPNAPNGDWQAYQQWVANGGVPLPADPLPLPQPDPKGFYRKLIGMEGDQYPLYQIYSSLAFRALDETQDTSSLATAMLIYNNALNINDWSLPEAKQAYLSAYEILKRFLSAGQISIIDAENINFRLV